MPVAPHVHTRWIVNHRDGCCSAEEDGACDCWPTVQCVACESVIDVGEWDWQRIQDGASVHFVGEVVGSSDGR